MSRPIFMVIVLLCVCDMHAQVMVTDTIKDFFDDDHEETRADGRDVRAFDTKLIQGTMMVRGSSGLNVVLTDGTPINILASGGYLVANNIMLGADVGLYHVSGEFTTTIKPFGRYYFQNKYFVGAGLLTGENGYITVLGGFLYNFNEFIALEPIVELPLVEGASISGNLGIALYFNRE